MYDYCVMQVQYYNITGLSPYQLITVTITATNGAGNSEPSNEVSVRTHEAGMIVQFIVFIGLVVIIFHSSWNSRDF